MTKTFDKSTYGTPPEAFNTLNNNYHFDVDICAEVHTAKCKRYFTKEQNSLGFRWQKLPDTSWIWCNPPYDNVTPWIHKAIDAQLNGVGVVMLLNNDASVGWYAEALLYASAVIVITASPKENGEYSSGRLHFIGGDGEPVKQNERGQVIFEFNPLCVGDCENFHMTKNQLMGVDPI